MTATCETCRFWLSPTDIGDGDIRGMCRRHAPRAGNVDEEGWSWPRIERIDWCGEHQPKDATP